MKLFQMAVSRRCAKQARRFTKILRLLWNVDDLTVETKMISFTPDRGSPQISQIHTDTSIKGIQPQSSGGAAYLYHNVIRNEFESRRDGI
ncbi:hypothetical protein AM493_07165 [Flavobacterium akiainvivens]|uniref:Uncharacterized protein n=1 Tax=Flavobacterium akiainvivens TaxID=1202724 RepID=A0A0M8MGM4_9FLAO|nr:hypothetical protein AM493_07165 [Flavobacterium akiainvivens]